jgi:CheY-like chemotaxis protein
MSSIVYLDDERDLTEIFELLFEPTHHSVAVFNNEHEAIEFCQTSPPDVFFVDYRLEHMNGDEVAVRIAPDIKKILVTGDIKVESDFKFDAIIHKPFKLSELLQTVTQFTRS